MKISETTEDGDGKATENGQVTKNGETAECGGKVVEDGKVTKDGETTKHGGKVTKNGEDGKTTKDGKTTADGKVTDGRFSYTDIYNYVWKKEYPSLLTKEDKQALRKRAKFFRGKEGGHLYYVGRKGIYLSALSKQ